MNTVDEAARTMHTIESLAVIEEGCKAMLTRLSEIQKDRPVDGHVLDLPECEIRQAMNFAWAMRTFPLFDVACLSRLREFEFEKFPCRSGAMFTGKLYLPYFAWTDFGQDQTPFYSLSGYSGSALPMGRFSSCISINFPFEIVRKNEGRIPSGHAMELMARAPVVPESVKRKVSGVKDRFDAVNLVWEAEWEPAPVKDPLVVGVIYDRAFLLDQFDVTKLERYIISEFTGRTE